MKPDWKDAPPWATWLIADRNGVWTWIGPVEETGRYWGITPTLFTIGNQAEDRP
jgi:hypothetical protein